MDFKSYIDELIKTNIDVLTKGKKRNKFSTSTTSTLQSLYNKSPNACAFFDQFANLKFFNNAFSIILKNDKNKKELQSIYDMFEIDAEYSYNNDYLQVTYKNGFKKFFEIKSSIVNIEQCYLVYIDFFDISNISISLEKNKKKSDKLSSILGQIDELIFSTDKDLFINFANSTSPFKKGIESISEKTLIGNNIFEVFPTTFCNEIKQTLAKEGKSFTYTFNNGKKDMAFEIHISTYKEEYIFILKDISNLSSMSNALNYLSNYDVLTGFLNSSNLDAALDSISSYSYLPIAVEKISFSNIKDFNEKASYKDGDKIIVDISKKIKSLITGFDISCRISGEELAIIFPNTSKTFMQSFHANIYNYINEIKKAYPDHKISLKSNSLFLNDTCESYKDEILNFLL